MNVNGRSSGARERRESRALQTLIIPVQQLDAHLSLYNNTPRNFLELIHYKYLFWIINECYLKTVSAPFVSKKKNPFSEEILPLNVRWRHIPVFPPDDIVYLLLRYVITDLFNKKWSFEVGKYFNSIKNYHVSGFCAHRQALEAVSVVRAQRPFLRALARLALCARALHGRALEQRQMPLKI